MVTPAAPRPGAVESGIRARLFNLGYLEQPDAEDAEYVD
jgi:hypothetical protein